MWFESAPGFSYQKTDCTVKLGLYNAGPGVVSDLQLELLVVKTEFGREQGVAEFSFPLEDLVEGEVRTSELHFKSQIPDNMVLRMRLSGEGVDPQLLELKANRKRF